MIRRPPRSTRTDTLFPYTTLFRSGSVHRSLAGKSGISRIWAEPADCGDFLLEHGLSRPGRPAPQRCRHDVRCGRSEEHTSELQSLMRISYAVFCLKKKTTIRPLLITKNQQSEHHEIKLLSNHY